MKDSENAYGFISKILHWLIAITIIGLLIVGFFMTNMDASDLKWKIYGLHKSIGITLIVFALFRILWRIKNKAPKLPDSHLLWQHKLSHIVHGSLYLISLFMPMSGWIMSMASNHIPSWFGLFPLKLPISKSSVLAHNASITHEIFAWVLILYLVLHIGAAITEPNILKRMLFKDK